MTTYGTIPAEPYETPNACISSKAKERIQWCLGTRRPWTEMLHFQFFSVPSPFGLSSERIKINVPYFRYNYVIITLFIMFVSMLWNPVSLIVFMIMMAAWLFLYVLRDDPLVVFDILIYDKVVMAALLAATIGIIFFTNVIDNLIIALFLGVVVMFVHGAFRRSDNLMFLEDDDGFVSVRNLPPSHINSAATMPLRNAASSSFSVP